MRVAVCLLVMLILFSAGCSDEGPFGGNMNLPEHCTDGLYNQGEQGRDCGWSCPNRCNFREKKGSLDKDETWSGNIHILGVVVVPEGVTLTILPGTVVKFQHDRNYKTYGSKGALYVNGGTIRAIGTNKSRVWFTSDAQDPRNGDWQYILVTSSSDSMFEYVIVEFGEMGIMQLDSSADIANSIIRWSCYEGIYGERSTPEIRNNLMYGNGYHEIALEQYNNVRILNNVFRDGKYGVHHEKTISYLEGNHFLNYNSSPLSGGMESDITAVRNKFENITDSGLYINIYGGSILEKRENDFENNTLPDVRLGFRDLRNFELSYMPGGNDDLFQYAYDDVDETRIILKRMGMGLNFGWTLEYVEPYLYRFSQDPLLEGELNGLIRIDPATGEYTKYDNDVIMNPRGLTWDGDHFYVNDFSLLKIFKFRLEGDEVKIVDSFDIPYKEQGGTMGLTTDSTYLYLLSRDGSRLYKMDKQGDLIGEIRFDTDMNVGNSVTWTGKHFWTWGGCRKGLCKWTKDGKLTGEIYQAGKDTWALTWDGEHLWTIHRGSEVLDSPKISQIQVLDDSLDPFLAFRNLAG